MRESDDDLEDSTGRLASSIFGADSHIAKNATDCWPVAIVVTEGIAFVGESLDMLNESFLRLNKLDSMDAGEAFPQLKGSTIIPAKECGIDIAISKIVAVFDCES